MDGKACIGCERYEKTAPTYFSMNESKGKGIAVTKVDCMKPEDK